MIDPWLGLVVFLALSGAAVWIYTRQRGPTPPPEQIAQVGSSDEKRVLVVANETVVGDELMATIGELRSREEVAVLRRLSRAELTSQDVGLR